MESRPLWTCPVLARTCVCFSWISDVLQRLTSFLEDHIGVSTIVEVDTRDETMDVLAEAPYLKKHEEL